MIEASETLAGYLIHRPTGTTFRDINDLNTLLSDPEIDESTAKRYNYAMIDYLAHLQKEDYKRWLE